MKLDFVIRIAGTVQNSIVDGPGIRYTLFTQGCQHNCKGCHNPQTFDLMGGKEVSAQLIYEEIKNDPLTKGVTFSGGEPFLQAEKLAELGQAIHSLQKDIITYTGFTFEELLESGDDAFMQLLKETDILIDGRFVLELKDLTLKFRGSKNQRILDCKKSLETGKPIEVEI